MRDVPTNQSRTPQPDQELGLGGHVTHHVSGITETRLDRSSVVTIGSFDGVHRGHRHLIQATVERARALDALSIVVTFQPHPRTVLRPELPICMLTTHAERARLIRELGVDEVVVVPFTQETARTSAEDFVRLLIDHLQMRALVVGPGFALGHRRQGTIPVLAELGKRYGFTVHEVAPFRLEMASGLTTVSSTRIREQLLEGHVAEAAALLGRPYAVDGEVVRGAGRGRQLGIPTANLDLPAKLCLPANGIYATRVMLDRRQPPLVGAASLGTRPMFDNGARVLEVYILDFDADIYGHHLRVEFIARLRAEERFPSLEAFLAQVQRDISETRRMVAGVGSQGPGAGH